MTEDTKGKKRIETGAADYFEQLSESLKNAAACLRSVPAETFFTPMDLATRSTPPGCASEKVADLASVLSRLARRSKLQEVTK